MDAGLPTSNIVCVLEMICAYLQILSPSPGADVASDPQDTTQGGEEKKPGGRSTDAAALQRSHLELLRDRTLLFCHLHSCTIIFALGRYG